MSSVLQGVGGIGCGAFPKGPENQAKRDKSCCGTTMKPTIPKQYLTFQTGKALQEGVEKNNNASTVIKEGEEAVAHLLSQNRVSPADASSISPAEAFATTVLHREEPIPDFQSPHACPTGTHGMLLALHP